MPLQTAVNPQTNETGVLVDGQWAKADQTAANPAGEKAYLVGGKWLTDTAAAPPPPKPEGNLSTGIGEAATQLATGAAGTVVGGLKGIWDVATGQGIEKATEDIQKIQQGMTYQPRTQAGDIASKVVNYVPQKIAQASDWAGDKTAEGMTKLGASPEAAGAVGAAVNTGLQFAAPTAILKGGKALVASRAAEGAEAAPKEPGVRKEPYISETPQEAAAKTQKEAETRAKDYARDRLAVDWDALSASFKSTLTEIAADAQRLDALPVDAVKRQAKLQSLKVPVTTTAGKLTRDATQLRNEANVAATDAGKPIRDIDVQTNRDLRANVEQLKQRVGGVGQSKATAATAEGVGETVQGALRTKEAVSKANYNALYKKARETDPDRKVPVEPISSLLIENPEIQHLGWVQGWLNKSAKSVAAKTGEEAVPFSEATLAELHDLRSKANDIAATGGKEGYYAGKVRAAIDATMENAPESAAAWREANAAFKAHKLEFEDTGAVDRMVADKTRNDPRTALEDTWKKSVQTAKLEEIRQLKRSLLSGGDEATRASGKKALRELRQETVNQYLSYITRKTATNEAGETQITAVQMNEGLKAIGGEARAKEILGARAVKELKDIIEAAKITKTEPSIRNAGSSTLQNILAFAEKWTDKVPVVGDVAGGVIKAGVKLREMGEAGRVSREAAKTPLDEGVKQVRKAKKQAKNRNTLKAAAPSTAPAVSGSMTLKNDTNLGQPQ